MNVICSTLRKCLQNRRGDIYFEYLICLVLFVITLSIVLQVFSAVRLKLWLDDRTAAIVRNVQINGGVTDDTNVLLGEVTSKLGESASFEWDTEFIGETQRIQLGEWIRLRISGETTLFKIGSKAGVPVHISSEMVGTSEIYWNEGP